VTHSKPVIVGIGNTLRGDDGAGVEVIQRLEKRGKVHATLIDAGTVPENALGLITKASPTIIVLVDAADMNEQPGATRELAPAELDWAAFSTHAGSLELVVDFLRQETGADVRLIGIQTSVRDFGAEMSEPIDRAVDRLVNQLERQFPFESG